MKSYLTMCITERNAEKEARRIAEVEARAKAEALARAGALWDDADITLEIAKEEILSYGEFAELKETEGKVQEQASDIVD